MSRSYKHYPCVIVGTSQNKKHAARAFRHYKGELGSGKCAYKRLFDSWEIKDWIFYSPEAVRENKKFRQLAKEVRLLQKRKVKIENYNVDVILEELKEYRNSFKYITK